jgi:hypothetical protein
MHHPGLAGGVAALSQCNHPLGLAAHSFRLGACCLDPFMLKQLVDQDLPQRPALVFIST